MSCTFCCVNQPAHPSFITETILLCTQLETSFSTNSLISCSVNSTFIFILFSPNNLCNIFPILTHTPTINRRASNSANSEKIELAKTDIVILRDKQCSKHHKADNKDN